MLPADTIAKITTNLAGLHLESNIAAQIDLRVTQESALDQRRDNLKSAVGPVVVVVGEARHSVDATK